MSSPEIPAVAELTLPAGLTLDGPAPVGEIQDDVLSLFDECGTRVGRYVRSVGVPADAADDVVQEVFLSLFRHLLLGRPRHNLQGWIFRVGHRLALKQREKSAVRWRRESGLGAALAERLRDPAADPERQLVDGQRRRRLQAIVRALPERDRQCLYLRAEGLRYREIASALEISLGAVAKSLARAATRLLQADEGRG